MVAGDRRGRAGRRLAGSLRHRRRNRRRSDHCRPDRGDSVPIRRQSRSVAAPAQPRVTASDRTSSAPGHPRRRSLLWIGVERRSVRLHGGSARPHVAINTLPALVPAQRNCWADKSSNARPSERLWGRPFLCCGLFPSPRPRRPLVGANRSPPRLLLQDAVHRARPLRPLHGLIWPETGCASIA